MNLTTSVNKALFNSTRYVSFFNKLFVKLVKNDFLSAGEKLKNWSFFLLEDYFAGRWSSMSLSQKISFSVWFVFSIPRAKKKLSFHVKSSTTESLRFLCNYRHNIYVPPFGAPHLVPSCHFWPTLNIFICNEVWFSTFSSSMSLLLLGQSVPINMFR